jgi:hypothetical protein
MSAKNVKPERRIGVGNLVDQEQRLGVLIVQECSDLLLGHDVQFAPFP